MQVVKCVNQTHHNSDVESLMKEFRWMLHEAMRIGVDLNLTSQSSFNSNVYHHLSDNTKFLKMYVSRAIQIVKSKLRYYRKALKTKPNTKPPYFKKPYVIVDKQSFRIINDTLLIGLYPQRPYIRIPLNKHTLEQITNVEIGAVTITSTTVSISIKKDIESVKPHDFIGVDTNLNNISVVHLDGGSKIYSVSEIPRIKEKYRKIKSHFRRNDDRIRKKIFQKYGTKQKHKTRQILHKISKELVSQKKQLIIENLTGIRKLYRKGNGKGREYRSRLNGWPFREFQEQLEYKSKWYDGMAIIKILPNKTSSKCSICGARVISEENRQIRCKICGHTEDRDINAARNILYKGIPVVRLRDLTLRSNGPQSEAVKQSKNVELIVVSQIPSKPNRI